MMFITSSLYGLNVEMTNKTALFCFLLFIAILAVFMCKGIEIKEIDELKNAFIMRTNY